MADNLTNSILTLLPSIQQCRLTLETGVPVSTTDQTGKTTVYLTPTTGNRLALFDGTVWKLYAIAADKSLALGTLTSGKNYDVFAYDSSGTVTLELSAAWTSDTARADALTTQDGILVKSGATTRRYLGTLRTTATTTTEDSGGFTGTSTVGAKRFLWNYYNRVRRPLKVIDTTNTWAYTTTSFRQANGATAPANGVEYVTGVADLLVEAHVQANCLSSNAMSAGVTVGVGIDSSTVNSCQRNGVFFTSLAGATGALLAPANGYYSGAPGLGYHVLNWLEIGATNFTFLGDNNQTFMQAGLTAMIES